VRRSLRVEWYWLLAAWTLVLLFVPPRRYQLPVELPFELDLNRLLTMLLVGLFLLLSATFNRALVLVFPLWLLVLCALLLARARRLVHEDALRPADA
jgi:hypothetical protein